MARTDPQLNIRIPLELKEKLEDAAKKHGRSVTAEIVKILEDALSSLDNPTAQPELTNKEVSSNIDDEAIRNDLRNLFDELSNKLLLRVDEIKNEK